MLDKEDMRVESFRLERSRSICQMTHVPTGETVVEGGQVREELPFDLRDAARRLDSGCAAVAP